MAKAKPAATLTPPAETPDQPYYLQKAHVKDYRSVRDAEVEFKPGLNIIIGPNGSGKTNFLRAIHGGIIAARRNDAKPGSSFVLAGRQAIQITYSQDSNFQPDPFIQQEPAVVVTVHTAGSEVVDTSVGKAALRLPGFTNYYVPFAQHDYPRPFPILSVAPDLKLSRTYPFGTLAPSFPLSLIESVRWAIFQRPNDFVTETEIERLIQQLSQLHLDILNRYLPDYSPIETVRLDGLLKVYVDKIQDEILVKGLAFEYSVNGSWWRFADLSDGTKRLIFFISEIISPLLFEADNGRFKSHERDKIILLEEPELGIHPHQLHLLLDLIRQVSRKHQVILTTHSPQVLDMLYPEELDRIIVCELKDPKKGTQFLPLSKAKIAKAKRYMKEVGHLSDYWMHSDMESRSAGV